MVGVTADNCFVYFDKVPTFAEYIINNIYVEDGVNNLYYHDGQGSYTNADQEAGDYSYRYSGDWQVADAYKDSFDEVVSTNCTVGMRGGTCTGGIVEYSYTQDGPITGAQSYPTFNLAYDSSNVTYEMSD